jgi:hypothetical protein
LQSRFSLVDLAGSERVARTHASGTTLKVSGCLAEVQGGGGTFRRAVRVSCANFQESIAINKSLFVLRNVIKSLAGVSPADDGDEVEGGDSTNSTHFRDSKLTALLKHSLGGNSLTLMVRTDQVLSRFLQHNPVCVLC